MRKQYIVTLTADERQTCTDIVKKLKGTTLKVRRANILLAADTNGLQWKDQDIADAYHCSRQCVENLRKRLVTQGFEIALNGQQRTTPPKKLLDGKQEAEIIALRLSTPPAGHNHWTLRLLADKVVELEIAPHCCHTTVSTVLKKTR
jgi:hypothetical protein